MAKTFSPLKVKNLELKNRIVMAPMCMYSTDDFGFVQEFHKIHYGTRAIGGVGLIIIEATAVERRGRITANDLGIWEENHVEGLKQLVGTIHQNGAKAGIQLAHAGRKCGVKGETIIAPSGIAFDDKYQAPSEMSLDDIKSVIEAFKNAADRANRAGFDTIEIHGAHGYLINQFISPLTNKRSDDYGLNKNRFLNEILDAVKSVWPNEKPIILRVSAEEYNELGNHVADLVNIINSVKDKVDIIDVSSGGVVSASMNVFPGYQLNFATKIKQETNLTVIGGGLITSPLMIEEIVQNDRAQLVYLGRELLKNPYFAINAADTLRAEIEWPFQYKRGK